MKKILLAVGLVITMVCLTAPITSMDASATPMMPLDHEIPGGGSTNPDGSFRPPAFRGTKVCLEILADIQGHVRNGKNANPLMKLYYGALLDAELGIYNQAGCNNQPGIPTLPVGL